MDYSTVTEAVGTPVSRESMAMMHTRYAFACGMSEGKRVLEVACGSGQGLGLLARKSRLVVGGDFSEELLAAAKRHYNGRVPLLRFDGHFLPFRDGSFDVLVLYEAIYYLRQPHLFLAEARRLLSDNGILLICTVNKDWPDFNPSPFSTRYFSAEELGNLLEEDGFCVSLYGAFPSSSGTGKDQLLSLLKRTAVKLHFIPRTMRAKAILKRVFFGRLIIVPPELDEKGVETSYPVPLERGQPASRFKVIFACARAHPAVCKPVLPMGVRILGP